MVVVMSESLTRAHLTESIYKEVGIAHAQAAELVDEVFERIIEAVATTGTVKLSRFGTFKAKKKKARVGRNPKTKEEFPIEARTVVGFSPSNVLKNAINNK
jgi:integration host factor subunit alpha